MAPFQVEVVDLQVVGIAFYQHRTIRRQLDPQNVDDRLRNLFLDRKYILHLPVVGFRPEVVAVSYIVELRRHP